MNHQLRHALLAATLALPGFVGLSTETFAQGCVAARFMSLSLGPDGVELLEPGQWQAAFSYRYLYADDGWRGSNAWPQYANVVGNRITIHSLDVQATYAFSSRFSTTLTVPYQRGRTSNFAEHDGTRHEVNASGLGDVRLVGSAWLFDPERSGRGNISLGLGVKAPTGDEAKTDVFYKPTGPEVRPVDVSIQPGDGGWGIMCEAAGYWRFGGRVFAYANGYYLINPREQNKAYTPVPVYGQVRNNSVADQYLARAGFSWAVWPMRGLTISLGARINGIPAHDLSGGNEGFRRPGYAVYVDPGIAWTTPKSSLNISVPVRVDANRTNNVYDDRFGGVGGGAFAGHLIITSYSQTF